MLHIVNKSPFNSKTLEQALRHSQSGDSLILIDDGSYATQSEWLSVKHELQLYALENDLECRALACPEHITSISIADFVELVFQHDKSISWY
jgi:tRNA 2-thiouridine synthesizing protein B